MTSTAQLLTELIALPSVNPAFLPAGHPHAGERNIGEFLAATAANAGLDVEFQHVFPGRSNVLARMCPNGRPRYRLVLAPHLDTVDAAPEQFQPRVRHERIYGRGACDTKGCIAAMLQALMDTAAGPNRPTCTEIVFAGLIDEENAQSGSRALVRSALRADLAIVGEPTCLKVVTAHKGSLWLRIETLGKSAHGSRPDLGENAVYRMAQIVHLLQSKYATRLLRRQHPVLGTATVSVGSIGGGTQPNIVPDHCQISVDRRTLPGETEAEVISEIRSLLKEAGLKARVSSLKPGSAACLPLETSPHLPLVRHLLRTAGQRRAVGMHYFCDAAVLSERGLPSVVFGPGDIAQAHTLDEWLSLPQLEDARRLLRKFFANMP